FFFQAEDGIRDFHVTGVQTCALPIFLDLEDAVPAEEREAARHAVLDWLAGLSMRRPGTPAIGLRISPPQSESGFEDLYALRVARSEERRVGRGCRTGRSKYGEEAIHV